MMQTTIQVIRTSCVLNPLTHANHCLIGYAGELMDNIGGYVNPLRLLQRMPEGMAIDRLRDRLVHIIADFRTQTSLREGCNTILHTDCLLLAQVGMTSALTAVRSVTVHLTSNSSKLSKQTNLLLRVTSHCSNQILLEDKACLLPAEVWAPHIVICSVHSKSS